MTTDSCICSRSRSRIVTKMVYHFYAIYRNTNTEAVGFVDCDLCWVNRLCVKDLYLQDDRTVEFLRWTTEVCVRQLDGRVVGAELRCVPLLCSYSCPQS